VVDRAGLENRCARKGTVGSNPTPSATELAASLVIQINGLESPQTAGFHAVAAAPWSIQTGKIDGTPTTISGDRHASSPVSTTEH
jgi:hypothetical protein